VLKVDSAISSNSISGVVLLCYENERPFRGAIAELDWRFDGHFSKLMKAQTLTGSLGETVYAPLLWNGKTLHFLVMGGGSRDERGLRNQHDPRLWSLALKHIDALKISGLAISRKDWNLSEDHADVKERNLCILN
jgi:hypothetical protein